MGGPGSGRKPSGAASKRAYKAKLFGATHTKATAKTKEVSAKGLKKTKAGLRKYRQSLRKNARELWNPKKQIHENRL